MKNQPHRHRRIIVILCLLLPVAASAHDAVVTPHDAPAYFTLNFHQAELTVLAEFIATITGKSFIFDDKVKQKLSIFSPLEVTAEDAWVLFQAALDAGGTYTLLPVRGRPETFLIVPRREAARMATPVVTGSVDRRLEIMPRRSAP